MSVEPLPSLFASPVAEEPPVPAQHAEPLRRLVTAVQENALALLARTDTSVDPSWLSTERLETHLRCALPDPMRVEVWPLLPDTWAIALFPIGHSEPLDALQVHALRETLNMRLCDDWRGTQHQEDLASTAQPESLLPFFLPPPIPLPKSPDAAMERPLFELLPFQRVAGLESVQGNLSELNTLLEVLVNRQLRTQFQPIVNLRDGHVHGYEALIRGSREKLLKNGGGMFRAADKARMVAWFDLACLEQCFRQAASLHINRLLFVNMEAEGLAFLEQHDRPLAMLARESGLLPAQIVIEITERQTVGDFARLMSYIARLREDGFKIAIDDAGAGYNSLNAIAELRPDVVKIDRALVTDVHANGERRALLTALTRYARQIGTAALGEGIETREELAALIDLGVELGQGYLMAKPADDLRGIPRQTRHFISDRFDQRVRFRKGKAITLGGLATAGVALPPEEALGVAARAFAKHPGLTSVVVVEEGQPKGILLRPQLEHVLSMVTAAHVADLLPAETVSQWMHTSVIMADEDTLVLDVAQQATTRSDVSLESDIVVTRHDGSYLGVVPIRLLLESALRSAGESTRALRPAA